MTKLARNRPTNGGQGMKRAEIIWERWPDLETKPVANIGGVHVICDWKSPLTGKARYVQEDDAGMFWRFTEGDVIAVRVHPVMNYEEVLCVRQQDETV